MAYFYTYKILGQVNTANVANSLISLYTCPPDATATISGLNICNRSSTMNSWFSAAVIPPMETNAQVSPLTAFTGAYFLAANIAINAGDNIGMVLGATLDANTQIACMGTNDNLSFNLYGAERRLLAGGEYSDGTPVPAPRFGFTGPDFLPPETVIAWGSTSQLSACSAVFIKAQTNTNTDGMYWITLNGTPTQTYCIMDSAADGGGWMLAMKATNSGATFEYGANYWTTTNTLNPSDVTRGNANAKYDTFNYYASKDIMAVWPDILTTGGGLGTSSATNPFGCWTWLENNYNGGTTQTLVNWFGTTAGNRRFIRLAKTTPGWQNGIFSSQPDINFYGFNWTDNFNARWGFGWNENGGGTWPGGNTGSDDVGGGIGMSGSQAWSAGDYISCCQDSTGINRQARVEVYVR